MSDDPKRQRFMTIEEAAVILGGSTRPFSRSTIDKLVRLGRIRATAARARGKRIIASSVYALADHLEEGGDLWEGEIGGVVAQVPARIKEESRPANRGGYKGKRRLPLLRELV